VFELHSDTETEPTGPTRRQQRATNAKTKDQKLQLKQLLAQPLLAQGISKRYITSGSNPIVHELLAGESESTICRGGDQACSQWEPLPPRPGHETMLGVKKTSAGSDLSKKRIKRRSKKEYEEWSGFGSTS
jgi:ATP-dependent RNA helicase DDX24/MAK5